MVTDAQTEVCIIVQVLQKTSVRKIPVVMQCTCCTTASVGCLTSSTWSATTTSNTVTAAETRMPDIWLQHKSQHSCIHRTTVCTAEFEDDVTYYGTLLCNHSNQRQGLTRF